MAHPCLSNVKQRFALSCQPCLLFGESRAAWNANAISVNFRLASSRNLFVILSNVYFEGYGVIWRKSSVTIATSTRD